MHMARYKSVLGLPGMKTFMLVALIARIPGTAWTTALTLSVVLDRHLSYAAAGAATAMFTVGLALGSPLLGRAIDRRGPRPVLLVTGVVSLLFWNLVPALPYPALLGCAVFCGALQVPIMTLVRQSLAQRVPESVRRQALYSGYVEEEVMPHIRRVLGDPGARVMVGGASFGAFYAANAFFRRPDLFDTLLAMSGFYDLSGYLEGYMSDEAYFNNPSSYLPNLHDHGHLEAIRSGRANQTLQAFVEASRG